MKEFDIEKLERKNIYKVPDNLFENIQGRVMSEIKATEKVPVFKLNWAYAVAASLVLIFGATFVFTSNENSTESVKNSTAYALGKPAPKTESEIAYETLKADLTSVENNNQTTESQGNKKSFYAQDNNDSKNRKTTQAVKAAPKQEEAQMNEYLDSFSNSEIAELASNSTQDVYLDLYN